MDLVFVGSISIVLSPNFVLQSSSWKHQHFLETGKTSS